MKKETKADVPKKAVKKVPAVVPDELIFEATLTVAQILKAQVALNVVPVGGGVPFMRESRLTFDRALLPSDYDSKEDRKYSLVIKRV